MLQTINTENKALQQHAINISTKNNKSSRAISNLRPHPEAGLQTIQTEIRSKSNVKEPNPQMNNYLFEKQ